MNMEHHKQLLIGAGGIIIIAILGWYVWSGKQQAVEVVSDADVAAAAVQEAEMVNEIGAAAEAPVVETVPTVAPETNPLKNIYKNPFE